MRTVVLILAALSVAAPAFAAPASSAQESHGQRLYEEWCKGCHDRISELVPTMPGTTALAERYQGARPAALIDRDDLTPEVIKFYVRNGVSFMPYFRKTELPDADLDRLATWLARAHETSPAAK